MTASLNSTVLFISLLTHSTRIVLLIYQHFDKQLKLFWHVVLSNLITKLSTEFIVFTSITALQIHKPTGQIIQFSKWSLSMVYWYTVFQKRS